MSVVSTVSVTQSSLQESLILRLLPFQRPLIVIDNIRGMA
jgi:hypothetical protein